MDMFSIVIFCTSLVALTGADDRIHFDESRWNTPPELTPEAAAKDEDPSPQPRFLPFSASFTLSAGGSNAHSLSVAGSQDGLSLSQSQSNAGSGMSASQSSSFSAGLSGISASDANSFNLNHPAFGGHSQADSNSFAVGQASATAQGNIVNNQASTGAQSSVGNAHSSAASGVFNSKPADPANGGNRAGNHGVWTNIGPNYEVGGLYTPRPSPPRPLRLDIDVDDRRFSSQRPQVFISDLRPPSSDYKPPTVQYRPFRTTKPRPGWSQTPLNAPSAQEWSQNPTGIQISGASASSSASSNSPNGFALGQSSSHSGPGLTSWSTNHAQSSSGGTGHAHGSAAAVGANSGGKIDGSFSSGTISALSTGTGHALGTSHSGSKDGNSRGQVNSQANGSSAVKGTANAGTVSFVRFPGAAEYHNIPREFVRSNSRGNQRKNGEKNVFDEFLTEVEDTVADIFDI